MILERVDTKGKHNRAVREKCDLEANVVTVYPLLTNLFSMEFINIAVRASPTSHLIKM